MRIVLVDPSRAVQRAMRDLIAQGGHEVLSLYNGQKALDCIKVDTDVRALITSVQLPDISDRKSTRLNSSHGSISYAVFCLIKRENITSLIAGAGFSEDVGGLSFAVGG